MKTKVGVLMTACAVLAVGLLLCEAVFAITVEMMKPTKIRLSDEGPEGPWLRCYINVTNELTQEEAEAVKKSDVLLEGVLNPVIVKACVTETDDGAVKLQVLAFFDIAAVKALLAERGQLGEVELTVTITVGGEPLSASDTVKVRK